MSIPIISGLGDMLQGRDPNHDNNVAAQNTLATNGAPSSAAYTGQNTALTAIGNDAQSIGTGGADYSMDYSGAQPGQMAQNDAMGLSGQLARGQGPSLSRANMNLGLSQGASNLQASQAGFGAQGGLGQRNMMNAMAGMQAQAAGQGAIAGAQEQIGNIQNYGALGSTARGQGLQQAGMSAQNAHQNTDQRLAGLGQAMDASGRITANNVGYDTARTGHASDVYAAQTNTINADDRSNRAVLDTGGKVIKGVADMFAKSGGAAATAV